MKSDEREVGKSGGNQPSRNQIEPVGFRESLDRREVFRFFFQLMRPPVKEPSNKDHGQAQQCGYEQPGKRMVIIAAPVQNPGCDQRPKGGAELVQSFIEAKYPAL